jgi:zinc transport system substrate-binding protein
VAPGTPHDHRADEHKHGVDPHVWLDPVLVLELVPAIRSAIQSATALRGEPRAEELETKEADMLARVREVDQAYRTRLAPLAGRAIVTHHAAFDRLADRYGLRIAAVIREVESGEPTPGAIAHVVEAIRKESVPAIFVEPQFDASVGARIAREAGVELGHLDPLGNGDWFAMMHANLAEIVRAFGATSKEKP